LQRNFTYSTTWSNSAWTTKQTTITDHDLVTGQAKETDYVYSPIRVSYPPNLGAGSSQTAVEQSVTYKDNSGHVLRTVTKSWQDQYLLAQQQTTLDNGSSSKVTFSYGAGGQRTEMDEYDFGQSTPSRITKTTYQVFPNTPIYPSASIFDRPCKVVVYDGTGTNVFAETDTLYDGGTTVCGTPGTSSVASVSNLPSGTHDEANYGTATNPPRGNATTITRKCLQACIDATTTYTFDETGQVLSSKDPCENSNCGDIAGTNHTTTYSFADNYDSPPGTNTNAYLTKATNALGQSASFKYAYSDGQLIQSTDPNGRATSYLYVDSLRRLTETDFPDNGQTKIAYNDTAISPTITTSRLMNTSNVYITSVATLDGLGHIVKTLLTVDQDCANGDRTDTTYDGLGRIHTVSNPYCVAGEGTSGLTTYIYDALGRTTTVTHPDGATILTSYTGRATEIQDEGNPTQRVTRISQSDGLGRRTSLCEVSSATLIGQNAAPAACSQDIGASGFLTSYQYNALDDLTRVTQGTMASRAFAYDSLSRLTSATNPESGTATYSYDANSNLASKTAPAPNQTGTATVITTYSYDALNRLTQKSYSDTNPVYANGTPTVFYGYDQSSITMAFQHSIANIHPRIINRT
jgi:YD repeat-containing protein